MPISSVWLQFLGMSVVGRGAGAVQDQLKKCATDSCQFPRFRRHSWGDGSVVTWGVMVHGGDSSAFAAILGDGSVAAAGGDSSVVQDQLKNLQQIQASYGAFAAILGDESIVTWGDFRL